MTFYIMIFFSLKAKMVGNMEGVCRVGVGYVRVGEHSVLYTPKNTEYIMAFQGPSTNLQGNQGAVHLTTAQQNDLK